MALRWFAGGDPLDIMQVHGVGHDEVSTSVWDVVDAVNLCRRVPDRSVRVSVRIEQEVLRVT
jgi:hypothetical protein